MFDTINKESAGSSEVERMDALVMGELAVRLEVLAGLIRLETIEIWKEDGAVSMADWLVGRYTISIGTAREWIRIAHALDELPRIREVYSNGRLSWDQLRALVRFVTSENQAEWAERAPEMTVAELRAVNKTVKSADVVEAHERRWVSWWFHDDRPGFHMTVDMADVEGAALATWLSRRANQYDPDPQFGVYEAFEARCADALYELASQALAGDRDHDRATLLVHTDLTTLLSGIGTASIDDGPALSNDTLRRLACDARLQLALTDPEHKPIGVGRTTRTIPPWLARLVRARDRGCRFPLCRRTRWTQVHHIIHWADGGPTNLDNLITLCGRLSFLRPWLPIGIDGGKTNELPPPAHPRTRMDHRWPSRRRDHLAPARPLRLHPGAAGAPAGDVEEGVEPDAAGPTA
jgi:hypothetical protein